MTAIVALVDGNKLWIGGDSAASDSGSMSLMIRQDEKVFAKGDRFLIGCTTSYRMISLLRYVFHPPMQREGTTDAEYMNVDFVDAVRKCFRDGGFASSSEMREVGGEFLVCYNKAIYQVYGDYQVAIPVDSYASCGCASDVCLGSLYATVGHEPESRIHKALKAAEHFSGGVRGPFVIRSL